MVIGYINCTCLTCGNPYLSGDYIDFTCQNCRIINMELHKHDNTQATVETVEDNMDPVQQCARELPRSID
jgi:hypothetical protein